MTSKTLTHEMPALGACLLCLAMSPLAQAQFQGEPVRMPDTYDAKTYPGITCEALATAEIDQFSNLSFDMVNEDNGKRTVVCPIVRDNTENLDGTVGVFVNIVNPANRTTECTLFSYDKFGVPIDSETASQSNAGDQTIVLDVDVSASGGFLGITCLLPQFAGVRSYEVREFIATDEEGSGAPGAGSLSN